MRNDLPVTGLVYLSIIISKGTKLYPFLSNSPLNISTPIIILILSLGLKTDFIIFIQRSWILGRKIFLTLTAQ